MSVSLSAPEAATAPIAPARRVRQSLTYPIEAPGAGEMREVGEGVLWFRIPLPYNTEHINVWLLADVDADGPGWAVVDTGIKTPQTVELWRSLIAPGGGLARAGRGGRLTRVICTHFHADHAGMAGWLVRKCRCPLWMTRQEYLTGQMQLSEWGQQAPPDALNFYAACGWSARTLAHMRTRHGRYAMVVHPFPDEFQALSSGQALQVGVQRWELFTGRGHSPEHACLVNEAAGLVIGGDQALPNISSNVSVTANEPAGDPLGDWIDSLRRLRAHCDSRMLVLPAHGLPYVGLHLRIDELLNEYEASLEALRSALQVAARRVIDVFPTLFSRPVELDHNFSRLMLATGKSLAHLNHLKRRGETICKPDGNGVNWWTA